MKKKTPKRERGRERSTWTVEDSLICGLLASVYQSSLSINKSNFGFDIKHLLNFSLSHNYHNK